MASTRRRPNRASLVPVLTTDLPVQHDQLQLGTQRVDPAVAMRAQRILLEQMEITAGRVELFSGNPCLVAGMPQEQQRRQQRGRRDGEGSGWDDGEIKSPVARIRWRP
jgi:hypothetical protein